MSKSIHFIVTVVLAAMLTSCTIGSDGAGSDISKPGTDITQAPDAPRAPQAPQRGPACHVGVPCAQ